MLVTGAKRLTLQQNITLLGVSMKLALLGRQALMGAMAVVLMAGVSAKPLRLKICSIRLKSAARYALAWKGLIRHSAIREMTVS
jgi:hypothetical protein